LVIFTPIVSVIWIGFWEPTFVFSMIILSISMFINILVGPAYFSCIGEGRLNLILKSQIIIGILNLILGFILGYFLLGKGVIISWALSVTSGSFYLFYNYQKQNKITLTNLLNKYNIMLFFVSILVIILGLLFYNKIELYFNNIWLTLIFYLFFMAFVFIPLILKNKKIIGLKKTFFKR
jgi:O-antigen/teichoic acid export membrane protein